MSSSTLLHDIRPTTDQLFGADKSELAVLGKGQLCLQLEPKGISVNLPTLIFPASTNNLVSVDPLEKAGIFVDSRHNSLMNRSGAHICHLTRLGAYKCIPTSIVDVSFLWDRL